MNFSTTVTLSSASKHWESTWSSAAMATHDGGRVPPEGGRQVRLWRWVFKTTCYLNIACYYFGALTSFLVSRELHKYDTALVFHNPQIFKKKKK